MASFSVAKFGTLFGLCNSISTPKQRSNVKITLFEHYWAYVTDVTLMVEPLPGNGRLKLYHNFYNHRIALIVQHRVNDTPLKYAKSLRRRE